MLLFNQKKFFLLEKLNGEEVVGSFYEKELQKTNQDQFRIEKAIKKKGSYMPNGKDMIIHSIVGLIKKMLHKNEPKLS